MFQPLYVSMLVDPIKDDIEGQTPSGVITISEPDPKVQRGRVLAVGNGERGWEGKVFPLPVEVGDLILYDGRRSKPIVINGESKLLVSFRDTYGILLD